MKRLAKILACTLVLALVLGLGGAALAALDPDDYVGIWKYDEYTLWYEFNADGTWASYGPYGLSADGFYESDGDDALYLYIPDGSSDYIMTVNGDVMTDDEGDTLAPGSSPDCDASDLEQAGAVGTWECLDTEGWLCIYPGGTWVLYTTEGMQGLGGARVADDGTILLLNDYNDDDSDALLELTVNSDGTISDGAGETFELSSLPFDHHSLLDLDAGGSVSSDFIGSWKYDYYTLWFDIPGDGTWEAYNDIGVIMDGYCEQIGDSLQLYIADGTEYYTLTPNDSGMIDDQDDTLSASSLPDSGFSEAQEYGAAGTWVCAEQGAWLVIYPGDTFLIYSDEGIEGAGYLRFPDSDTVLLMVDADDDDSDALLTLSINSDDTLTDDAGDVFVPGELPFSAGSSTAAPDADTDGFDGTWVYDDYSVSIGIYESLGSFIMLGLDGNADSLIGTLEGPDEDGVLTLVADNGDSVTLTMIDSDTLVDWEGDTLTRLY